MGDTWTFRRRFPGRNQTPTYSETVLYIGRERITLENLQAGTLTPRHFPFSLELNPLYPVDGELQEQRLLDFPLHAGKTWKSAVEFAKGIRQTATREAIRAERIRIEAGEFDCFRIESLGFWSDHTHASQVFNNGSAHELYWYAPAAKRIVKYGLQNKGKGGAGATVTVFEQAFEMVEFKLAG